MPMEIPEPYADTLGVLAGLTDTAWADLMDAIKSQGPRMTASVLVEPIAKVAGVDADTAGKLVTLLVNTYLDADSQHLSAEDSAENVARKAPGFLEMDADAQQRLGDRLAQLYALHDTFGVMAKATSVIMDRPRSYCASRVLTDLRPIFTGDKTPKPTAFAIVHSLRLSVHEDAGDLKEYFFSLTAKEMKALSEDLERARQKADELRKNLTDVKWLEE